MQLVVALVLHARKLQKDYFFKQLPPVLFVVVDFVVPQRDASSEGGHLSHSANLNPLFNGGLVFVNTL